MRSIKLKSNGLGRYDDVSPFLVTDKKLGLKIELPNFCGEFYFVAELNNTTIRKLIPADGRVTLDDLSAGELTAEVKHYMRGELIKTYKVEPLLLKEVDGAVSAIPEIELLTGEIALLTRETNALRERTEALEKQREEDNDAIECAVGGLVYALLAYSYAEYENDVQLNARGLSIEELAEVLGLSTKGLSEEEIEEIKNVKEKL